MTRVGERDTQPVAGVKEQSHQRPLWTKERSQAERVFRAVSPRFSGEDLDRNLAVVDRLREIAAEKHLTVAQLAIAWVLARGEDIVPLVGARKRDRLQEALLALEISLTAEDKRRLEAVLAAEGAAGGRYPQEQLQTLDSERTVSCDRWHANRRLYQRPTSTRRLARFSAQRDGSIIRCILANGERRKTTWRSGSFATGQNWARRKGVRLVHRF